MSDLKFFNALRIVLRDNFKKLWQVIDEYKKFEHIYSSLPEIIGKLNIKSYADWNKIDVNKEYERLEKGQVKIVTFWDKHYPELLREAYIPPLGLYVKGNLSCFNDGTNLAVIGSRHPTEYGQKVTEKIISELAGYKVNIVSGLAIGMDTYAHKYALNSKLRTIGIIGSGFIGFHPKRNIYLAREIVKNGGAVVSEYPIDFCPQKYYFVARNRIISGMSKGILIIEARKQSGTLITAKFAEEQNRDLFIVPNNIFAPNGEGTNQLIKEGAKLVNSGEDIVYEIGLEKIK